MRVVRLVGAYERRSLADRGGKEMTDRIYWEKHCDPNNFGGLIEDRMTEEKAMEIADSCYPIDSMPANHKKLKAAILQALEDEREKAKGLVEALESIVSHQKFVGGRLSDISTIRLLAERALARYKEKK
jgi:hypothetical protein